MGTSISNVENVSQVTVRVQIFSNTSTDLIQYNFYTGVNNEIICKYHNQKNNFY